MESNPLPPFLQATHCASLLVVIGGLLTVIGVSMVLIVPELETHELQKDQAFGEKA